MKLKTLSILMAIVAIHVTNALLGQQLPLPKPGAMVYDLPNYTAEVKDKTGGDLIKVSFGIGINAYGRLYQRLHDNVFAELKDSYQNSSDRSMAINGWVLILQPNDVVQLCEIRENNPSKIFDIHTLAPTKEGLKAAKGGAKEIRETFDLAGHQKQVAAFNEALEKQEAEERAAREAQEARLKAEKEAKAQAEREAKEKAKAEREAGLLKADFCPALTKYAAMVPSRFKALKGKVLPLDDMYQKGDTTFEAAEVMQYFDFARVQTRHKSIDNATDLDFYMKLGSAEEVTAKYAVVQGRLKACLTEKAGWFMNAIMGNTCSFVKGKVAIMLREYNNTWDDDGGNFLHLQISSK